MTDSRDLPEFDPLAVENIGVTPAVELLEQPLQLMPPPEPFAGEGVYALCYAGNHPAYAGIARRAELDVHASRIGLAAGAVGVRS